MISMHPQPILSMYMTAPEELDKNFYLQALAMFCYPDIEQKIFFRFSTKNKELNQKYLFKKR